MPKEKFYNDETLYPRDIEHDTPDLVIQWGDKVSEIKGQMYLTDRGSINRMIRILRRVRNRQFGKDE